MGLDPDTLIGGTSYKKVNAIGNASGSYEFIGEYYVRSDPSGKGYLYLPSIGVEVLTGDVATQVGDTVQDVLVAVWNAPGFTFLFRDLVVDSVVLLSNEGVSVTRHYLDPTPIDQFNPFNPISPSQVFWQAGMGTAYGPFVIGSSSFYQCVVNDTMQYDISNDGLPGPGGAGQLCWQLNLATPETAMRGQVGLKISPNPVADDLVIELVGSAAHRGGRLALYDPTGRVVLEAQLQGPGVVLDVSPMNGFYTVVIESEATRMIERVIIQ
jgi:hypothetical protein